jgi:hypothetical protein
MKRNLIANIISIAPVILYNAYTLGTKEPNSGIDFSQVIMSALIAMISFGIGNNIKNKGKVQ